LILEGGSIESDGNGTLLVTQSCLLSPNRNEHFSKIEIEEELKQSFAVERVLWLKHGYLAGDDTDGHIDMLTRYINEKSIMYLKCDDNNDEHYHELTRMEDELKQFKTLDGSYYELIPVPLPKAIYDSDGRRLPATYLNFLIINGAVLLPVYNNEADNMAIDIFKKHFREREVIPVNCLPLLNENGSLHCATMQLPEGCL
jgi:agmatine deiminase